MITLGVADLARSHRFWGGYSGYFADPDDHLWEVAWGAFDFDDDGSLRIP
jgi:catechol 2,3-dioxygenase-like lactoylglutathione lyase family enzyme